MARPNVMTVVSGTPAIRRAFTFLVAALGFATSAMPYEGPAPVTYDQTLNGIRVVFSAPGKVIPGGTTRMSAVAYVPIASGNVDRDLLIQFRKRSPLGATFDTLLVECNFVPDDSQVGQTIAFPCEEFALVPPGDGETISVYPYVRRESTSGSTIHDGRNTPLVVTYVTEDGHEQNDSIETATDVGVVNTSVTVSDLVLADTDVFQFTTPDNPSIGSATIRVDYWDTVGNVDARVLNTDGDLMGVLTAAGDGQRLTFAVSPNTAYYLRVQNISGESFFYDLRVSVGPPDNVTIVSGPTGTPNPVTSGRSVRLFVQATDSAGHELTFLWSASCSGMAFGNFSGQGGPSPTWFAPRNFTGVERPCTITVNVVDPGGVSAVGQYTQVVLPAAHEVIITNPPSGTPNPVAPASDVTLSVFATDTNGHELSYLWQANCPNLPGPGTFTPSNTDRSPLWTSPSNPTAAQQSCSITVSVTDTTGLSATGSYQQVVDPATHTILVAEFPGGTPNPVNSGGIVQLSVAGFDSHGHDLTYRWTASCPGLPSAGRFSSPNVQKPIWTAPANLTDSEEVCMMTARISDPQGTAVSASYTQMISPLPDQVLFTGQAGGTPNPVGSEEIVSLSATATDSHEHTLIYAWQATCPDLSTHGTFVPDATRQFPTWRAPRNVSGDVILCTIEVTANDSRGHTATSSYVQQVGAEVPRCEAFAKLAPRNLVGNQPTNLELSWTSGGPTCSYEYCVDQSIANNNVCDSGWVPVASNTSVTLSGLAFSAVHYWQVRASNNAIPPSYVYANGPVTAPTGTWWRFITARKPTLTVSVSPIAISESATAVFTIRRSGDLSQTLDVQLTTGGSAKPGVDLTLDPLNQNETSHTLTLLPGAAEATVTVAAIDDTQCEGDETVTLALVAANAYVLGSGKQATVTLLDDDLSLSGSDLVVSTLTSGVGTGDSMAINFTVRNQADATADPSTIRFFLSPDGRLSQDDRLLDSRAVAELASFRAESGSANTLVPTDLTPGPHYLIAHADADLAVCESEESNNTRVRLIYFGPDLLVQRLSTPGDATAGGALSYTIEVKNVGTAATGPSVARFYLSQLYGGGAADDIALGEIAVPALQPGETWKPLAATLPVPPDLQSGIWYLVVHADATGSVQEGRETNNSRTVSLWIY